MIEIEQIIGGITADSDIDSQTEFSEFEWQNATGKFKLFRQIFDKFKTDYEKKHGTKISNAIESMRYKIIRNRKQLKLSYVFKLKFLDNNENECLPEEQKKRNTVELIIKQAIGEYQTFISEIDTREEALESEEHTDAHDEALLSSPYIDAVSAVQRLLKKTEMTLCDPDGNEKKFSKREKTTKLVKLDRKKNLDSELIVLKNVKKTGHWDTKLMAHIGVHGEKRDKNFELSAKSYRKYDRKMKKGCLYNLSLKKVDHNTFEIVNYEEVNLLHDQEEFEID